MGSIYEGLLDYRFRVEDKDIFYIEFEDKKTEPSYFDSYDLQHIPQKQIEKKSEYLAGELFLSNSDNSRKESASYYTPESISSFMVEKAINRELERKSVFEIKIALFDTRDQYLST